jgi:hypothetical protein
MANIVTNIHRALADFDSIKTAIEDKGVNVGNAPTSEYGNMIAEIQSGAQTYYSANGRLYTKDIVFPSDLKNVGGAAYQYCTLIETVTFPDTITDIGNNAFQGCTKLKEIYIPEGVTRIAQNAFFGNPISTVYLPSTLTSMGASVFSTQYFRNVTLGQGFNLSLNIGMGSYTVDCMIDMFNALKDNTGTTAKTLTLGATNLAKLTAEQLQIATEKNWNVA